MNGHPCAMDVRFDGGTRSNQQTAFLHRDLALDSAVNGDVLAAGHFASDGERRSDSRHGSAPVGSGFRGGGIFPRRAVCVVIFGGCGFDL
jgi:hypothetical protein